MKNFGTLFGYELKKIWTRPMTWAAVLVFCAAFVWITVQPFFRSGGATFTATDANGSEISRFLTAGEQYRLRVEGARKLSGQPMDEARVKELLEGFDTIDHYIRDTWKKIYKKATVTVNEERVAEEMELEVQGKLLESQVKSFRENRVKNSEILMRGLKFVNRHGQPLHMMPKLELDPELLEQPLYH